MIQSEEGPNRNRHGNQGQTSLIGSKITLLVAQCACDCHVTSHPPKRLVDDRFGYNRLLLVEAVE